MDHKRLFEIQSRIEKVMEAYRTEGDARFKELDHNYTAAQCASFQSQGGTKGVERTGFFDGIVPDSVVNALKELYEFCRERYKKMNFNRDLPPFEE